MIFNDIPFRVKTIRRLGVEQPSLVFRDPPKNFIRLDYCDKKTFTSLPRELFTFAVIFFATLDHLNIGPDDITVWSVS